MTPDSARCPVEAANEKMEPSRQIRVVPNKNENYLTEKEQVDYKEYRKTLLSYLLKVGKNPQKAQGYSPHSVYATGNRLARFDLWVWNKKEEYAVPPSLDEAAEYMGEVAYRDVSEATKGKIMEALLRYSKWLQHQYGQEEWSFDWSFQSGGGNAGPRDFLTSDERQQIRQAALHKGDGWKYTSIIWTALDAALRPVEVGRAKTSWVDIDNQLLRIPREESSKNEGNWRVSLTSRTTKALGKWLEERDYEDTDKLWLTQSGNKYEAKELSRLLKNICDEAGIS